MAFKCHDNQIGFAAGSDRTGLQAGEPGRYFFHLTNGVEEILDDTGIDVASLEEARAEAYRAITDIIAEEPDAEDQWIGWSLNIADANGRTLVSIKLTDPCIISEENLSRHLKA